MAEFEDREHYIPLRKADLIQLLATDKQLPHEEREPFRRFCRLVGAVFHFEYLRQLEDLKDAYAPFDPDSETKPLKELSDTERQKNVEQLFARFIKLMERANFAHLSWKDVQEAMAGGASDWGINMEVDPKLYEHIEIFARGDVIGTRTRRRWWNLWRLESVRVPLYKRLVFIVKLRPDKRHGAHVNTRAVFVKAFKEIPKLDLEMILPGARLEIPSFTRWKLGGSVVGGLGFVGYKIVSDVLKIAALGLGAATMMVWGPIAALFGYGYKQYYTYSTTKNTYSLMLTQSLYYQNLDNNCGVLTRLLDEAEEQECREVLLGYYCLWKYAPAQGWTSSQLDDYVELFLEGTVKLEVDFEIGDALDKLERLQLVEKTGDHYRAVPLGRALNLLDSHWQKCIRE